MAYNNQKGPQHTGDIQYEGDPNETQIDFENDNIKLKTSGSTRLEISNAHVSASGPVSGSSFWGDGSGLTGLPSAAITSYQSPGNARVIVGTATTTTVEGASDLTFDGSILSVGGQISASLGVTGSSLRTEATVIDATHVSSSLNVSASAFYGDGSALTGLPSAAITSYLNPAHNRIVLGGTTTDTVSGAVGLDYDGTVLAVTGNISASINISGAAFYGDGSTLGGVGSMSSFVLAGDAGSSQTLEDGNTVTIAGGTGLTTTAGATDTVTIDLDNTAVSAGSYTYSAITVDAQGRLTAASNGTAPAITSYTSASVAERIITSVDSSTVNAEQNLTFDGSKLSATGNISASLGISGSSLETETTVIDSTHVSSSLNISGAAFWGSGIGLTDLPSDSVAAAGANTQIQFNNTGSFGASADLTWTGTHLFVSGTTVLSGTLLTHDIVPIIDEQYSIGTDILRYENAYFNYMNGGVAFDAVNDEGVAITRGQVVYIKGISGGTPTVALAACDDPAKMPAFGFVADGTINNGSQGRIVTMGRLNGLNTTAFSEGDILYVQTGSNGTSGSFTAIRPTGSNNLLQNIGKVTEAGASGQIRAGGAGRSNATPNLDKGYLFVGQDDDCSRQDNTIFISSSANKVGINNTDPDHTLTITGDVSASAAISASSFYGDGSNLDGISAGPITNYNSPGGTRIITSVDASTVQGESNLTFDGSVLSVTGDVSSQRITSSIGIHVTGANPSIAIGDPVSGGANDGMLSIRPSDTNNKTLALMQGTDASGGRIALGVSGSGAITVGGAHFGGLINVTGSSAETLISAKSDLHSSLLEVKGSGAVGIINSDPKTALDVHHNPTTLANDTGGGEVVKFGAGTTVQGKTYYLHSNGNWDEVDISVPASGGLGMLATALGTSPSVDGMLIRGFFDYDTQLVGGFTTGATVYLSGSGQLTTIRPSGSGESVRVVGTCTTTGNVIYFNPSPDYLVVV